MDALDDRPILRGKIIVHFCQHKDAELTSKKYHVTPEFVVEFYDFVVQRIVSLFEQGLSMAEIRRITGYGKVMIRNTLIRLGKYTIKQREMSDPFVSDPPASALVHIPDPQGVYVGFDLLPDEAMRLAKIQIIRRCGVNGYAIHEYESAPGEPISPYDKRVKKPKGL